jgi:hypothetical protein
MQSCSPLRSAPDLINTSVARVFALLGAVSMAGSIVAQLPTPPPLPSLPVVPAFPLSSSESPLVIQREAVPARPFSVVGPRGAVLGQQDGSLEVWLFPRKILSNLRISAQLENYSVPIDVNEHAAGIEVRPEATIITFAHAAFTVREIIVAPKHAPDGSGALILYQVESVRPLTLTFSFTPNMQLMWPAASEFPPDAEWVTNKQSGFYIVHLNFPDHAAAIAMPTTVPGVLEPYQERAANYPTQFVLHFDPKRDARTLFPLLITASNTAANSRREALAQQLLKLDQSSQSIYEENRAYYQNLLTTGISF